MTTQQIPINLKWTLHSLRVRMGMTLEEASKQLNVSVPTLKNWENDPGTMQFKDIDKVTKLYHIPQEFIFFGSNLDLIEKLKNEKEA